MTKFFTGILIVILLFCFLTACSFSFSPPDIHDVEDKFSEYESEIDTIMRYFLENDIVDGFITKNNGTIKICYDQTHYVEEKIESQLVIDAVNTMFSYHKDFYFDRDGNTIEICIWVHPIQSISSSIAYSTNGIDIPQLQTPTEIIPMSKAGWYYIIQDYDKWMAENPPPKQKTEDGFLS